MLLTFLSTFDNIAVMTSIENLKKLRLKLSEQEGMYISITEMAKRLGIAKTTYLYAEHGKNMSDETIFNITQGLKKFNLL